LANKSDLNKTNSLLRQNKTLYNYRYSVMATYLVFL